MARPRLPGWPLESRSNAGPRQMITGSGNGASQNPAYRPSPAIPFWKDSSSRFMKFQGVQVGPGRLNHLGRTKYNKYPSSPKRKRNIVP